MILNPEVLFLLVLVPVFAVFFVWRSRMRERVLRRIGDSERVLAFAVQRRWWNSAMWLVALVALIVALARPIWGIGESLVQAEGISVVVVLDVSVSMTAQDVLPNRLDRAKLAARQLIQGGVEKEVALILFAGSAFVQFPLTYDTLTAENFLNAAGPEAISRQGTALEDALRLALSLFDPRRASQSVIVVFTDGENHEGVPQVAAEAAAEAGITIHVIGYGTPEGAQIPIYDDAGTLTGYKTDRAGNVVVTVLQETVLQEVAKIAGGDYWRASESGIEVVDLLNQLDELEATELERRRQPRRIERFGWFVAVALVALSIEIMLPWRRT